MKPLKLFFVSLAMFCAGQLVAQNDTVSSFNRYYLKSVDKLRDLYEVRGASFVCEQMNDPFREVNAMISNYGTAANRMAVIFYSFNNDSLQIWLLRKNRLVYHYQHVNKDSLVKAEVDIRKALKVDLLLAARNAKNRGLSVKSKDEVKRPELQASLVKATNYLLPAPIAEQLKGIRHLVVIPEFNISQFPLYLLRPYKTDSYLVDSVSISIAPHLCNLAVPLKKYEEYIGRPLKFEAVNPVVVGNPAYTKDADYNLSPLPGAAAEADTIAAMLNTIALKGKDATLGNVLNRSRKSNFLYFATHGYADLEKGLAGSFLAFTPDSLNAKGLWNAKSIQSEKFTAEASMAILSACQTGVGKIYDAGFIGIGRAFYKAGIDHTIMSLWSVDDAATKKLMIKFVHTLTEEELYFYPASHLRKAILQFKTEDPDPAHWAPFMLFGFPY